jgi:hypothetical protein
VTGFAAYFAAICESEKFVQMDAWCCDRSQDEIVLTSSIETVMGPTPPGTGVMYDAFEVDVSDERPILEGINTDANYHRAGAHHLRENEVRPSGGDYQNVGENCKLRQILSLRMANADGRFVLHQHQRHRCANDIAGADHNDILVFERDLLVFEQFQHAVGRARRKNRAADHQPADVVEMEAVDILVDGDGVWDTRNIE